MKGSGEAIERDPGRVSGAAATSGLAIDADRAALLIVDVQERLAGAMAPERLDALVSNLRVLCEAARRFRIPVVVSEQYPRGLGLTVPALQEAFAALPADQVHRFEKLEFSACAAPRFAEIEPALARDQWIATGMEAHICVYQTARQLCQQGRTVHLVKDAVLSRTEENRATGCALMERAGVIPSSTEVVVFDLLQRAGTEEFKALSRLIR